MDDNTAAVLITVPIWSLWAIAAIIRARRPRACNCPCQQAELSASVDLGK